MPGVPPEVAVQPVSHMDQLLGDDHFKGSWMTEIDARHVDQDEMLVGLGRERVGSANRRPHPPAKPTLENRALRRDAEPFHRKIEQHDVPFEEFARFRVIDSVVQHADLHMTKPRAASRAPSLAVGVRGQPIIPYRRRTLCGTDARSPHAGAATAARSHRQ